jgi:hypothetical protein
MIESQKPQGFASLAELIAAIMAHERTRRREASHGRRETSNGSCRFTASLCESDIDHSVLWILNAPAAPGICPPMDELRMLLNVAAYRRR